MRARPPPAAAGPLSIACARGGNSLSGTPVSLHVNVVCDAMVRGDLALPSPALLSAWRQLFFFFEMLLETPQPTTRLWRRGAGGRGRAELRLHERGRARGEWRVSPVRGGWPRGRRGWRRMPVREREPSGKASCSSSSVGGRHPLLEQWSWRATSRSGWRWRWFRTRCAPRGPLRAQNVIDEVKSIASGSAEREGEGLSTCRMRPSKRSSSCLCASSLPRRRRRRTEKKLARVLQQLRRSSGRTCPSHCGRTTSGSAAGPVR